MSSIIDQLSSPTTVLTCGVTTILLLGTTLYYINNKNSKGKDGSNNNNTNAAKTTTPTKRQTHIITMASTNISTTNFNCASCGKEGDNLNMCNKCQMVKYCNASCKKKHRTKHKKACERRAAELHDEELFKEHPPREECPICLLPLPHDGQIQFKSCCGKLICRGCIYAMDEESRRRKKIGLCAFCREPHPSSDADEVKRVKKLMESNNANAFHQLAIYYARGSMGMPQDIAKANELRLRAGELGCADGYYNLGNSYHNGRGVLEVDKKKAKYYWELAAMNGSLYARHNLGSMEAQAGNIDRAFKHYTLSARAGDKDSLDPVKQGFLGGIVTKEDYANTLRAYQDQHDEMKSETRDKARAVNSR